MIQTVRQFYEILSQSDSHIITVTVILSQLHRHNVMKKEGILYFSYFVTFITLRTMKLYTQCHKNGIKVTIPPL